MSLTVNLRCVQIAELDALPFEQLDHAVEPAIGGLKLQDVAPEHPIQRRVPHAREHPERVNPLAAAGLDLIDPELVNLVSRAHESPLSISGAPAMRTSAISRWSVLFVFVAVCVRSVRAPGSVVWADAAPAPRTRSPPASEAQISTRFSRILMELPFVRWLGTAIRGQFRTARRVLAGVPRERKEDGGVAHLGLAPGPADETESDEHRGEDRRDVAERRATAQ
jgi:hypothetical protein